MKALKDIFVTYEIAQKLKEIGFDEPCIFYYNSNKEFMMQTNGTVYWHNEDSIKKYNYNSDRDENLISSPTYGQVKNWFIKQGENIDMETYQKSLEQLILNLIEAYKK